MAKISPGSFSTSMVFWSCWFHPVLVSVLVFTSNSICRSILCSSISIIHIINIISIIGIIGIIRIMSINSNSISSIPLFPLMGTLWPEFPLAHVLPSWYSGPVGSTHSVTSDRRIRRSIKSFLRDLGTGEALLR